MNDVDRDELWFDADMSVRYHRRRARFLELVANVVSLTILVLSGGAFVAIVNSNPDAAKAGALLISLLGLFQFIGKPQALATQHKGWLKRWHNQLLEIRSTENPSQEQLARWLKTQYEIEGECVGEMRALQADSFNRSARALGLQEDQNYRIRWYHRPLMQLISFENGFQRGKA